MSGPHGHQPGAGHIMPAGEGLGHNANSSMAAVAQLFARLSQEIEEHKPKNCVHFIVDFLCKHYPEHLHGFASIWQMDPDLERERHEVVNFFKSHKISTAVAAHFTNAGYDTLDTLTTLSPDALVDVEAFNNVKWLPGHKVRLQQIFSEISARVRAYRQAHPNQTAQVVGAYGGGPAVRADIRALEEMRGRGPPGGPPAIKEYIERVGPPMRIDPIAKVGLDVNHDGRPDMFVAGVDRNRDGIPDVLQQRAYAGAGPGAALALQGHAGPFGPPHGRGGPPGVSHPSVHHHLPGGSMHGGRYS